MEVRLDKRYPIAVDAERAWRVLGDLHALASCMPGAELTEQLSESQFRGCVTVKVGLAVARFGGEVERIEIDPSARRVRLNAKGADKGGSSASMDLTASVEPGAGGTSGEASVLVGVASVIVNGKFAQFGGRMMGQVSDI